MERRPLLLLRSLPLLALGFVLGLTLGSLYGSVSNRTLKASFTGNNLDKYVAKDEDNVDNVDEELDVSLRERVLCWVMTSPPNHDTRAMAVRNTWGKHCNMLYFVSSQEDKFLPSLNVHLNESRSILWAKTKFGFQHAYQHYLNEMDWFVKADDDTFLVVDNLRAMLSHYSPDEALYFGCKFKTIVEQGYMSGGAGYVLSREALRRFVEIGLKDKTNKLCKAKGDSGAEDAEMGKCMQNLNVTSGDSRDSEGQNRFMPFPPSSHVKPGEPDKSFWYWNSIYYPTVYGPDCCSSSAVAFHYVGVKDMYVLDYFTHKFKLSKRNPRRRVNN